MRAAVIELADIVRPAPPKWNISKLARHFKVDRSVVRAWLAEEQVPSVDQISEMERLLGIRRDKWFMESGVDAPQKKAKGNGKERRNGRGRA